MTPIRIEIVAPMLTTMVFACRRCSPVMDQLDLNRSYRGECSDEYPEDMKRDAERLAGVIARVRDLYKHRVSIRMIDAQSPMGLWKQIRHRFAQLPGFVVDGTLVCSGCDSGQLESLIDRQISRAAGRMADEGAQTAKT